MTTEALSLEALEDQVRALTVADSPAEVFKGLIEGARLAAPRATVFLVRQEQLKGWGAVGYPAEAARRQREYVAPLDAGWLGRILESEGPLTATEAASVLPGFGQPHPDDCVGLAVRLKGRSIAVIVGERKRGELPWYPPVLAILVRVAQLRLDLDLARGRRATRRSSPTEPSADGRAPSRAPGPSTPAAAVPPTTPRSEPSSAVAAARESVAEIAAVAPESTDATARREEPAELAAARRYARLVATDIRLYNEEAVVLGRRNGDLAERLNESLMRGKETFERRHASLGTEGMRILREAYTDVLAGGREELIPPGLLD